MALNVIQGKNVAFLVEKPLGSGTFIRVTCAGTISLDLSTGSTDVDCVDAGVWEAKIPDTNSWTASADLTARTATSPDDATNITLAELIALQMTQTIFPIRFTLDDNHRYGGNVFITGGGFKGQTKGAATGSIKLQGTGPLALVASGS